MNEHRRPDYWPGLACAWCWTPLRDHGRYHSLVGVWRRRLAQVADWWRRGLHRFLTGEGMR